MTANEQLVRDAIRRQIEIISQGQSTLKMIRELVEGHPNDLREISLDNLNNAIDRLSDFFEAAENIY